jgi:hypothetical protein
MDKIEKNCFEKAEKYPEKMKKCFEKVKMAGLPFEKLGERWCVCSVCSDLYFV